MTLDTYSHYLLAIEAHTVGEMGGPSDNQVTVKRLLAPMQRLL